MTPRTSEDPSLSLSLSLSLRNSDAIEALDLLHERLRSLARNRSRDCGWRVPDEAAEQVYDWVVDRLLRGDPPEKVQDWAGQTLRKTLVRGPKTCEPGLAIRPLDDFVTTPRYEQRTDRLVRIHPESKEWLARMSSGIRHRLAPRQAQVFDRIAECRTITGLAKRLAMDPRNCLRILGRIAEKCRIVRESFAETSPPPPPCR